MKILVFGAGAVGSVAGGFLSQENDVTFLGRKTRMDALRKKGLRISGIWGDFKFRKFSIETEAQKIIRAKLHFDLILLTVKAYDTAASARILKKIITPSTIILSLQNGLGNIEALSKAISRKQILAGRVIFGAAVPEPGHVKITVMAEPTAIGEAFERKATPRVRNLVKVFNRAGIPSAAAPDIEKLIWKKVIYNCALNPLCSLLSCHYGFLTESQETLDVMNAVIDEIYTLAGRAKVKLDPPTPERYKKLFYSKLVAKTYNHRPSMLQDLENGKKTEIEALSGAIVRLGRKWKVETPVNSELAKQIRRKEAA